MEKGLPDAGWQEELAFSGGNREIFRIEGDSMSPTLREGDFVLVNPSAAVEKGDIVLARHPFKRSVKIIKRVAEILPGDRFMLGSDNPESGTDSRSFGAVPAKDILGKAEARIKPENSKKS